MIEARISLIRTKKRNKNVNGEIDTWNECILNGGGRIVMTEMTAYAPQYGAIGISCGYFKRHWFIVPHAVSLGFFTRCRSVEVELRMREIYTPYWNKVSTRMTRNSSIHKVGFASVTVAARYTLVTRFTNQRKMLTVTQQFRVPEPPWTKSRWWKAFNETLQAASTQDLFLS